MTANITVKEQSQVVSVDYGDHQIELSLVNGNIDQVSLIKSDNSTPTTIQITAEIQLIVQGIQDYQASLAVGK